MVARRHFKKAPVVHALAIDALGHQVIRRFSFNPIQASLGSALGIGPAQADSNNTALKAGISNKGFSDMAGLQRISVKRRIASDGSQAWRAALCRTNEYT